MVNVAVTNEIEQGLPVGPQVYRILRDRIIRGELSPGSLISESEIGRSFMLSRQPIREAFIKLSEEGLVEVRPQRGTLVKKISVAAVMDARFVREAIEADVVKAVAENADPSVLRELRQQLQVQRDATNDRPETFMRLDELFHRTLAVAAGKLYAWKVIEDVKAQMDRVRYLSVLQFPVPKLIDQHAVIIAAIADRDPTAAVSAMRGHLREIIKDLPAVSRERPEFFENEAP
ncbi:MAG: GntR family transcriptional regulator [Allorhizobium sp.]